jgi:diacylglycerol kinase family enzyme
VTAVVNRSARRAAWVAVLAAAAFVVALVALGFRNVGELVVVVGLLAIAAAAGWLALTRHATTRLIAIAVAAAAVVGSVVVLIVGDAIDELIITAVAAIVFSVASRHALKLGRQRNETVAPRPRRDGAVLLMNPKSGGGKAEKFNLAEEAKRRGIRAIVLAPGDDLAALAREAVKTAEVIGMAGGDGSQALVAQIAAEHDIPFVCVPAGTRNHLALDLGLDRDDVVGALEGFTDGIERRIDMAYVNDRPFVNNVSLGVYAEIVQRPEYRDAKLETFEKMLPELLGPRANPLDLRYVDPDEGPKETAHLLLVSNNRYVLDHLGGLGSRPRLDDGLLGILTVQISTVADATSLIALHAAGHPSRYHGWREWAAPDFEVQSNGPVETGIDGEAVQLEPPLRFRTDPAALRVRLPVSAPGASPAALRPGLSTELRELWGIASGRA